MNAENTMNALPKRRLGRGLAALIGDDVPVQAPIVTSEPLGLKSLPIDLLKANPKNPRRTFNEDEIESLANSLKTKGLLQPIMVRPIAGGEYEIVAGERRWRAAQRAGLHMVPAIVRELDDRETLEIAIIENVQRSDLNPLEEARAYKMLQDQYSYTQQQLAEVIGKSRSHIANTMRLTTLPELVLAQIENGKLSAGHARTLVATENPEDVAEKIIKLGLSVRQAEDLTRKKPAPETKSAKPEKDADTRQLEKTLGAALGLTVSINHKAPGGQLVINYKSLEQLDLVAHRLSKG
jgi:ParB family transcriptional regulator, chromosome partitioning protein